MKKWESAPAICWFYSHVPVLNNRVSDSGQCSEIKSHDKSPPSKYCFNEPCMSQFLSRKKGFIAALVALFLAVGGSAAATNASTGNPPAQSK